MDSLILEKDNSYVSPSLDCLEETTQENLRNLETTTPRRIVGVNSVDKRRMDGLRVEVGVKESQKTLVRSWLKWAGHVERIKMKNRQRNQMPKTWRRNEARKTENAMEGLR